MQRQQGNYFKKQWNIIDNLSFLQQHEVLMESFGFGRPNAIALLHSTRSRSIWFLMTSASLKDLARSDLAVSKYPLCILQLIVAVLSGDIAVWSSFVF